MCANRLHCHCLILHRQRKGKELFPIGTIVWRENASNKNGAMSAEKWRTLHRQKTITETINKPKQKETWKKVILTNKWPTSISTRRTIHPEATGQREIMATEEAIIAIATAVEPIIAVTTAIATDTATTTTKVPTVWQWRRSSHLLLWPSWKSSNRKTNSTT